MVPVEAAEKPVSLNEGTRISVTIAMLVALVAGVGSAIISSYAARDQAVTQIKKEIQESADTLRTEREDKLSRYMSREEFWTKIEPRLIRFELKLDAISRRP